MLHFAYVAIFSNQILENKQVVFPLLVRGSQIGRKKKDSLNAIETLNAIVRDLGNAIFSILVNESRDLSGKEQMDIVL